MIIFLSRTKIALLILVLFLYLATNPITALANSLVLNEILVHPSSGSDWVEIFNPTIDQIDLNNWIIADSTSNIKNLTGNISSNSFVVFEVSKRLNNSRDSISLKDPGGVIIDSYSYNNDPGTDKSFARSPDGGSWIISSILSKNSSNPLITQTPVSDSPSPTSTDSPTPTKTEVVFTISSTPSSINSSQSFTTKIEIKGLDENSNYYLKEAFLKDGSSNYFGKTKVQNNWIKNNQTYSSQFPITTDSSGNWSGNLEVMADPEDSGFTGSGDYLFKVGRYNDSGLGPIWSNVLNINIDKNISNDFNLTNPANSPSPIASKTKTVFTAKDISQNSATSTVKPKIPQSLRVNSSSVAGVSVENDQQPKIKNEEKPNFFLIIGIFLFLSGIGVLFLYYKKY